MQAVTAPKSAQGHFKLGIVHEGDFTRGDVHMYVHCVCICPQSMTIKTTCMGPFVIGFTWDVPSISPRAQDMLYAAG